MSERNILELSHITGQLPGGGQILILNTDALLTPEDVSMLQALYSRSPASVLDQLNKLAVEGSGKFMSRYYVKYGHKSIADCGFCTIFFEGVSMLAAKALQDNRLYNGQECSTRYIDFSTQPFRLAPSLAFAAAGIVEEWRRFYVENFEAVMAHVATCFPQNLGEDQTVYENAIKARTFDILRSILPAGAETSLSWSTSLRKIADQLMLLRHHPLEELRVIAQVLQDLSAQAFPHSFGQKVYPMTEDYNQNWMNGGYLFKPKEMSSDPVMVHDGVSLTLLADFHKYLDLRPPKTELPSQIGVTGTVTIEFLLDFGSYRDIQRHRAVIQRMPLLSPRFGFETWYLDQMPVEVKDRLVTNVLPAFEQQWQELVEEDHCAIEDMQYLAPMGYRVPCRITGDLPAWVYLVELRSGSTVHPTLRRRAQQIGEILERRFGPQGLRLYLDSTDMGRFDIKRGTQTIVPV